jgi:hypothetical protein
MVKKKLKGTQFNDPDWITEIAVILLDINVNELSENQKKILRDTYIDNLRNGMKPKDAIKNALEIVKCFIWQ